MRRIILAASLFTLLLAPTGGARAADPQTFTGVISDDMCGLDHSGMGETDEKKCTLSCVESGSDFVLADREHKKVYLLDDQKKPKEFAGAKVTIVGTLEGETIHVQSITAAKP
jgi:hypothetical protein